MRCTIQITYALYQKAGQLHAAFTLTKDHVTKLRHTHCQTTISFILEVLNELSVCIL